MSRFPRLPLNAISSFLRKTMHHGVVTLLLFATSLIAVNTQPASASSQNGAQAIAHSAAKKPIGYGAHGMAVFGGQQGLYASHLPMFHAPHDRQVVFRFHLANPNAEAAVRRALAEQPALWTLDPEPFDLHRLAPGHTEPLRTFTANVVQGHFERGGVARFTHQPVVVDEVLIFRNLNTRAAEPGPVPTSAGRYQLIGAGREYFAVKAIDRRPDFDILIAMKPLANAISITPKHREFQLSSTDLQRPTVQALQAALASQSRHGLEVGHLLYFETDDLK